MSIWLLARLLLALVSFGTALLAIVPAPTVPLFRLSIGATEFGHWFVALPLLLLTAGPWSGWCGLVTVLLSLASCGLFLSSAVRGQFYARTLPAQLAAAFPKGRSLSARGASPFAWRALWSAPRAPQVKVEVRQFACPDGFPLALHFFRCSAQSPVACVIVVHGGGWESGSPEEFAPFNRYLVQRGYAVAAVTYRFAPRWPWPAQREDVLTAIRYLRENATELGIDPAKFVILGRSAGGQIAETVAYSAHDPAILGCIAFYAPADIHFAYEFARDDDIISSLGLVRRFMAGTPDEVPANYDSASGILLAEPKGPPTLLLHGRRDPYVWYLQSQRLARRLCELGSPNYFVDLPWATHGFDFNLQGPGGQIAAFAVGYFLDAVTQ